MILSTLIDSALGIQHILASGQYPEYLYCVDQATIAAHLQKCCQESIIFINDQYNAIQGDYPILTAYDSKIHDLELELMANKSQEVSSTSLAAAHQSFERIYHVKKYIPRHDEIAIRSLASGRLYQTESATNRNIDPQVRPGDDAAAASHQAHHGWYGRSIDAKVFQ